MVGLVGNSICCYCIGLKFGSRYSCQTAHGGLTQSSCLYGNHHPHVADTQTSTHTHTHAHALCARAHVHIYIKKWVHLTHIIQLTINKAGFLYALLTCISISQVLSNSKKSINISFKFSKRNFTKVLSISEGQNERQNCSPS